MKFLFVCAANAQRSPSFENWFKKNRPQYDVKSAGVYHGYPNQVNQEILDWADKIFVMDLEQEMFLRYHYPEVMPKVEVIGCNDQYNRESPEINHLIWYWTTMKELRGEL